MNLFVLVPIVLIMLGLRILKPNMVVWTVVWWVGLYSILSYAVIPPLPSSIINMFMLIVSVGLLAYITSNSDSQKLVFSKVSNFIIDKKYKFPRIILILAIPFFSAIGTYRDQLKDVAAPMFGRTVHPAPPTSVSFKGKSIDIIKDANPYRKLETENPEQFKAHVKNGMAVYVQNCVFCHGDDMDGKGMYAHALSPIPTNFQDPTTIAMLTETFLFWRIAKGGPGLPEESGYWETAMPAWEKFLTEEQIWDVILYLYNFTDAKPRGTSSGGEEGGGH